MSHNQSHIAILSEGQVYGIPVGGKKEKHWIAFFRIIVSGDKKYFQYIGSKYRLGTSKQYEYVPEERNSISFPDESKYLESIRSDTSLNKIQTITLDKFHTFYDSYKSEEIPKFLFGKKAGTLLPKKGMLCYGRTLKSYICLISEADYATSPDAPFMDTSNSLLKL